MSNNLIKEIIQEAFKENIMNNLDSAIIFKYIQELEQENKRLKQWDCNKDSRNSRQRVANKNLIRENQQLKEEIKATKEVAEEHLKKEIQLKEVIEEVRECIKDTCYYPELENYSNMTSEEVKELLQILDKVKENK